MPLGLGPLQELQTFIACWSSLILVGELAQDQSRWRYRPGHGICGERRGVQVRGSHC